MAGTSRWTAVALASLGAVSLALYLILQPPLLPEQVLYGNGHVEGDEIRIASEIAGRVDESNIVEGRRYERGALLLRLDGSDLALQKQRAEAQIETLRQSRERVEQEARIWLHHKKTAQVDLDRSRTLTARGTISPQQMEQAENAFEEARGKVAALDAEAKAVASRIRVAESEVALVVNGIAKTRITAPVDGTIMVKAVEAGEIVQPGQILAVQLNLAKARIKVFIPEKDIAKVTHGAAARIRVNAFPDRYFPARVAQLDERAQFTPRDIHMPEERERLVFGVTLAADNPDGLLKPGMPADAWILWAPESGWPDQLFIPR